VILLVGVVARLLERDAERARIDVLLAAARGGDGQLLVITGPAGIGKTSLLEECARDALARDMRVLRTRADELMVDSSYAAVRDLFWGMVRSSGPELLAGAARLASPVFDGNAASGGDVDRAGSVLYGLYWLVANVAERGPLLLLLDDAHWLDLASAHFLEYLARRLEGLPVLLAVAARSGEGTDPSGRLRVLSEVAASVLTPPALSEAASGMLVRQQLGARADEELCRSCHRVTGGNPFYLRELTRALSEDGSHPTSEMAAHVRELGVRTIGRRVLVRLARLGSDCEALAQSLAVLGPACRLREAAALAGLEHARASPAADRLRAVDLVAGSRELSFVHPIVEEAIAAELSPSHRARLHRVAARLLLDAGAAPDRVGAHLLAAEPFGDAWVVDALRVAARLAVSQGAPEAAASYLRRAMAEPPDPDKRLEVLMELGRAETLLPVEQDFRALREALELAPEPSARAELSLELGLALFGVMRAAAGRAVIERALEGREELEPEMAERLEATLIGGGVGELSQTPRLLAVVDRLRDRAARGAITYPMTLACVAMVGAVSGMPAAECCELAELALADDRLLTLWLDRGYASATAALAWADGLGRGAAAAEAGIAEAQRRGSAPMFFQLSWLRSDAALRAGELDVAEDHAVRAIDIARELGGDAHVVVVGVLALVLVERGRLAAASDLVESFELADAQLELDEAVVLLCQRGIVRVAAGARERGLADLLEADRRMSAAGIDLSVRSEWVPAAASTLAQLGQAKDARKLADRELAAATQFGSARRRGIALMTRGLLDTGAQRVARLTDAVTALERSPARLEHARALVRLGEALGAQGQRRPSRESLAEGLQLADRCGAARLAEQARAELLATGARPRRTALTGVGALTPAELRTARMAAHEMSNREIAQALFVSVKAVEGQLSQTYAKLGIRGRGKLHSALGMADRQVPTRDPTKPFP
jgi:DNA-binding CsgD family transcriptional regulator